MGAFGGADADPFGEVGLNRPKSAELGGVNLLTGSWRVGYSDDMAQGAPGEDTKMDTRYIVTNDKTGQALGRTSIASPMRWVEPQFAATYVEYEFAKAAAVTVFGGRETHMGDVRIVTI